MIDNLEMMRQLIELQQELERVKRERDNFRNGYLHAVSGGYVETPQPLTPEQVQHLLMLCHPDKHDNSDLSNAVTKWLLSMKRARRGTDTRRTG